METRLRISTLGGLSIQLGGKRINFSTRKAEALLVYLISSRQDLPREAMATLLWEEQSQVQALTSLRTALAHLRKHLGDTIHATRTIISIDGDQIWFDVEELDRLLEAGEIDSALTLFRGEFLEGFYIKGAATFENWLVVERERIRQLVRNSLHERVSHSLSSGDFEAGFKGTQQLLGMDPLDELAQRKMMTLLVQSGQRTSALTFYEECRNLLWEELGIEPEEASTHLYQEIKTGLIDIFPSATSSPITTYIPPPAFLDDQQERFKQAKVVAREGEIEQLKAHLATANNHQGRVVFITGRAGQGKTSLVNEFIWQAIQDSPELLVVSGHCSDYAGMGDPYLPFRDVMGMLTGDVESRWASGAISRDHALRLWQHTPTAIQALMDYGPYLIDLLVPAADLIAHTAVSGHHGADGLEQVTQRIEEKKSAQAQLEQNHIFEQITSVLRAVAKSHPLLITLDDFQWADLASISLLFHLGRRITDSRIMVVCTYRPDEISKKNDNERHPLERVVGELKRLFGDIWIELDQAGKNSRRAFVDAFLDSEPNKLGEDFRQTLYGHTRGHPLFTVELLRAMQERGDLIKQNGNWSESEQLDWGILPARIEAVIEERVGRLDSDLRESLSIASVEGEEFTAQVVAHVQGAELRSLIRRVSQELLKLHRIVRQSNPNQIGKVRLYRYKFHHILFQKYLYDQLETAEKEILHYEVAVTLEKLFDEQSDDIAPQLAYHYHQSNDLDKARHYYARAGQRAQSIFANDEAIEFYTQALALTHETDARTRFDLLLAREKIYNLQGYRDAQADDLNSLEIVVQNFNDSTCQADVALRKANYMELTGDFAESIESATKAIEFAQAAGDEEKEARGLLALGLACLRQGEYEPALLHLNAGLKIAEKLNLDQLVAEFFARLGLLKQYQGISLQARENYEKALAIYRLLGNRMREAYALNSIGNIVFDLWNNNEALDIYHHALSIFREVGDQLGQGYVLNNLGLVSASVGGFQKARKYYEDALSIFRAIDHPLGEAATLNNLGESSWFLEDYRTGRDYYEQALRIFQESGNRPFESYGLTGLGNTSLGLGQLDAAASYYQQSIALDQELGNISHSMEAHAGLAQIAMLQTTRQPEYLENGYRHALEIVEFLEQGNKLVTSLSAFWIYLTVYRILLKKQDPKAEKVLGIGYQHFMEWSEKIADSEIRKTLRSDFRWIREIIDAVGNQD